MSIAINNRRPLHLFEGFGVEMEYMIVDRTTLQVLPAADRVLHAAAGKITNEISADGMAWSNELVLHVIEVKTDGPAVSFEGLGDVFQQQLGKIEEILAPMGAMLMPGAMHPLMNPHTEMKLWPHDYNPIYEAYNRIFDCRGHGWANLQSTHLNLPFSGDEEFEQLHAAVRLILPLIPVLAASSPIAGGVKKPFLDYRMEVYRTNSIKIPSITGLIIPEPAFSRTGYRTAVLDKMYRDIAPYDPEGILQEEWLNSRGAISRWDRNSIEVRVIDIQECPRADIAILEWIVNLLKALIAQTWCSIGEQKSWTEQELYPILMETIRKGEQAEISNDRYLSLFGLKKKRIPASVLCRHIFEEIRKTSPFSDESVSAIELILKEGPLARRILKALPGSFGEQDIFTVYEQLCSCLSEGNQFVP